MITNEVKVVIIGAGLTGLSMAHFLRKLGKDVVLIEKDNRVGGVINTIENNGFVFETGPNTGIIGSPEIVELFDDLKNSIHVEIANPLANNRWIWRNCKWNALPNGLFSAITTPLFSIWDKVRILGEPFRSPGTNPDETVAEIVKRRMGKSYLDYAVDPFISGIYAGDPNRLVTRYALPKLYNLEQKYGSFIKGAIKKRKEPKSELEKRVSREVFSIKGGLNKLVNALKNEIGEKFLLTGCQNMTVNKTDNGFSTHFIQNGKEVVLASQYLISTVSGNAINEFLPFIDKVDLDRISNAEYAKVVQVVLCYNNWEGIYLNAFGGLIPSVEKKDCLGILFPSTLFENRAPKTGAILSIFMGGIKKPLMVENSDHEIEQIALKEVKEMLKCSLNPDMINIFRYHHAIPQYEKSSGERLNAIEKVQKENKGLILAGNIRDGIGMSDRVKQAKQIALEIF